LGKREVRDVVLKYPTYGEFSAFLPQIYYLFFFPHPQSNSFQDKYQLLAHKAQMIVTC